MVGCPPLFLPGGADARHATLPQLGCSKISTSPWNACPRETMRTHSTTGRHSLRQPARTSPCRANDAPDRWPIMPPGRLD